MFHTSLRSIATGVAIAFVIAAGSPAIAKTVSFTADLKGASETPANDSAGTGALDATYNTKSKVFRWTITYSGLSGDAAAAHFHGPAAEGVKAPPVVPITGSLASPIKGTAKLTAAQAKDLQGGMWYFNIHSKKFPDGEIRGQVTKK